MAAPKPEPIFWKCERDLDDFALRHLRPDDYKIFHAVDRLTRGNYPSRQDAAISLSMLSAWTGLHRNVVSRSRHRLLATNVLRETRVWSWRGSARLAVNRDPATWMYHPAGDTQQVTPEGLQGVTHQVQGCHPPGAEGVTHQVQECHPPGDTSIEEIEESSKKGRTPADDRERSAGPDPADDPDYYADLGTNVRVGFVDRIQG